MLIEESSEARSARLYIACGAASCCYEWNARRRVFLSPRFWWKKRFFKRNLAHYLVQKWANKSDGREKQAILANTGSSTMEFVKNREKFWKTRHIGSPCDHHSRCSASTASFYLGTFSFMLYSTSNQKSCVKSRILRQINIDPYIKEERLPRMTAVGAEHRLWRSRGTLVSWPQNSWTNITSE